MKTNYKVGQLIRLTYMGDVRPELYIITHVKPNDQYAYTIKRKRDSYKPGGMWQEYQLTPPNIEDEPELFL